MDAYLSRKETNVFLKNMFSKSHLQQSQTHVERLNNIDLLGQRMVPSRKDKNSLFQLGHTVTQRDVWLGKMKITSAEIPSSAFVS